MYFRPPWRRISGIIRTLIPALTFAVYGVDSRSIRSVARPWTDRNQGDAGSSCESDPAYADLSAYRREVLNSTLNRASGVVIYIVFPSSPPNVKLTNELVPAGACNEAICLPAGEKTHNPPGPAV